MATTPTEKQLLGLATAPSTTASSSSTTMTPNKTPSGILSDASKHWPIFFVRGVILLILGTAFVYFPEETVQTMSILFGVTLLLEGANAGIQMCALCTSTSHNPLGGAMSIFYFVLMALNLGLGIAVISYPDETTQLLLTLVAVYFVVMGLMEIVFVCCLRTSGDLKQRPGALCCMLLGGMLYLSFGISMLSSDMEEGAGVFGTLIGIVLMVFALQIICFACFLRAAGHAMEHEKEFEEDLKMQEGLKKTDTAATSSDGVEESEIV